MDSGPELPTGGSVPEVIKEIALLQLILQKKQLEVAETFSLCQAILCAGDEDRKPFWDSWRSFLSDCYPFTEDIKKMDRDKIKEYMNKHMDTGPIMVKPLPRRRKGAAQALSEVWKRQGGGKKRSGN